MNSFVRLSRRQVAEAAVWWLPGLRTPVQSPLIVEDRLLDGLIEVCRVDFVRWSIPEVFVSRARAHALGAYNGRDLGPAQREQDRILALVKTSSVRSIDALVWLGCLRRFACVQVLEIDGPATSLDQSSCHRLLEQNRRAIHRFARRARLKTRRSAP